ncbi:MAG: hypothetical protein AMXMBFR47_31960 [Planctomycetota bacterium]
MRGRGRRGWLRGVVAGWRGLAGFAENGESRRTNCAGGDAAAGFWGRGRGRNMPTPPAGFDRRFGLGNRERGRLRAFLTPVVSARHPKVVAMPPALDTKLGLKRTILADK